MHHKYLFEVEYRDGTRFEQNPEDTSVTRPYDPVTDSGGSAFTDVKVDEVLRFHLVNQEEENDVWSVDLSDGHFEHNFKPFTINVDPFPYGGGELKLIYSKYRNEYIQVNADGSPSKHLGSEYVGYKIGFETKDKRGRNIQMTIIVN